ncbi:MAG: hypothetical protein ACRCV9_13130 [Burkholderiaceae bacterium]
MARPPKDTPDITENPVVDVSPIESTQNQELVSADQMRNEKLNELVNLDFDYSLKRATHALLHETQALAYSTLRIGAILVMVRERESSESFEDVLKLAKIGHAYAKRFMSCAKRFGSRKEFQSLERSKLMALASLDDETLDDIQEGSIIDLKLDDVDRMTNSELRDRLRQLREEKNATDERLTEARKAKDDLQDKLEQRERDLKDKRKRSAVRYVDLTVAHANLSAALMQFHQANDGLLLSVDENGPLSAVQENGVSEIFSELRELAEKVGIARNEEGSYV